MSIRDEFEKQWKKYCECKWKDDIEQCRACHVYKKRYIYYLETHTYSKVEVEKAIDKCHIEISPRVPIKTFIDLLKLVLKSLGKVKG